METQVDSQEVSLQEVYELKIGIVFADVLLSNNV